MNTFVKLSVASALALGGVSAQAAISQPSGGSSDLILFAEIINSSGTVVANYAGDTGVAIDTVLPIASLQPSGTTVPSTGFTNISLAPGSVNVPADANLKSFLALDAQGDMVEWAVEAGEYSGNTSTGNIGTTGNADFLTTNANGPLTGITNKTTTNLTHWAALDSSVQTINASIAAQAGNPSTTSTFGTGPGVWDPTAAGASQANWFSNGPTTAPGLPVDELGGSQSLYGVTGNGGPSAKVQMYALGSLTLTSEGTLEVAPVPLPAAVWLFGSGLLGLIGVGRRKSVAQA